MGEEVSRKEDTADDFIQLAKELTGEPQTQEEILAERAKSRNLADAEELFASAHIKKRLELPSIGAYVEYMPLRSIDNLEINKLIDPNQDIQIDKRNRKKVYLLLSRADKRYTEEAIDNLQASVVDAILLEYQLKEESPFLLPILNRRRDGLRRTLTPRS